MSQTRHRCDEDEEERRAHLRISQFQEETQPSPVSSDSDQTVNEEELDRSYSPLPSLTIEIEPKVNKHDESDEYYELLEKRIMKIYRKLFCEDHSDANNASDSAKTDISITNSKNVNDSDRSCTSDVVENTMTETDNIHTDAATQAINSQKDDSEFDEVESAEIESTEVESTEVEFAEVESVEERSIATENHEDVGYNGGSVRLEENDELSPVSSDSDQTFNEEQLDRSYSPLPSLTIEIEPKINKHDESDEFYELLEKKIMKIYKKLFCEDHSDANNVSDGTKTDISITNSKNVNDSDRSCTSDVVENTMTETDNIHTDAATQATDSQKYDSESEKIESAEIKSAEIESAEIVSAEVESVDVEWSEIESAEERNISPEDHEDVESNSGSVGLEENDVSDIRESIEKVESQNTEMMGYPRVFLSARRSLNSSVIASVTEHTIDNQNKSNEGIEPRDIEGVRSAGMSAGRAEKSVNTTDTANHFKFFEGVEFQNIEKMRSPRVCVSVDSMQNEPYDDSHHNVTEVRERQEARIESESTQESFQNAMDSDEPIDFDTNQRSLIPGRKNTNENVGQERLRKRSRSPSPSQKKRGRFTGVSVDVGVQSDFEDVNRRIMCENIFVGIPRIFKLCPCHAGELIE